MGILILKGLIFSVVLAGIAAGPAWADGVFLVGPRVTTLNEMGMSNETWSRLASDGAKMSGQITYGKLSGTPPADWYGGGSIAAKVEAVVGSTAKEGVATQVRKWVPLAVSGANLAKLARIASAAGALMMAAEAAQWAYNKGWSQSSSTGVIVKETDPGYYPTSAAPNDVSAEPGFKAYAVDAQAASDASCVRATELYGHCSGTTRATMPAGSTFQGASYAPTYGPYSWSAWGVNVGYWEMEWYFYPPGGEASGWLEYSSGTSPVDAATLEAAIKDGLRNSDAQTQRFVDEAIGRIQHAIGNANKGWPNQHSGTYAPPSGMTPEQGQEIQNILDLSIDNSTKTIILNEGDTNITNNNISQDSTNPATKDALPTGLEGEQNPEVPDEEPIPEKLDTFWSAVQNLPIVSLLTGINLTASGGSPTVQVTVPRCFDSGGTTITMNFSEDTILGVNYAYFLALAGNVLLAFTGIRWTMYLFKSGE